MLVRLHRGFVEAEDVHLEALVQFLKTGAPVHRNTMLAFMEAWHSRQPAASTAREREWSKGTVFELRPRADELNRLYFGNALTFSVSWNRHVRRTKTYPRTLHLGLCSTVNKEILIHPLLDQPGMPEYFLDYILFHEMTHLEVVPRPDQSGRMIAHSKEFYAKETQFPRYKEAIAFQEKQLTLFIRSWWKQTPTPVWAKKQPPIVPILTEKKPTSPASELMSKAQKLLEQLTLFK